MSKITKNFYSIIGTSKNEVLEHEFETIRVWMEQEQYEEAIKKLIEILNEDPMNIEASILLLVCKIDITADSSVYKNLYENNSEEFIDYIKQLILLYEKIVSHDKENRYQKELKDYILFVENMKSILENKLKYVEKIKNNKTLLLQSVDNSNYPLVCKKDRIRIATKYYLETLGIIIDFTHVYDIKSDLSYKEQMVYGVSFEELELFFRNANKILDKKYKALFIRRIFFLVFVILGILCLFFFK